MFSQFEDIEPEILLLIDQQTNTVFEELIYELISPITTVTCSKQQYFDP